jgi:hypothetical protein
VEDKDKGWFHLYINQVRPNINENNILINQGMKDIINEIDKLI